MTVDRAYERDFHSYYGAAPRRAPDSDQASTLRRDR